VCSSPNRVIAVLSRFPTIQTRNKCNSIMLFDFGPWAKRIRIANHKSLQKSIGSYPTGTELSPNGTQRQQNSVVWPFRRSASRGTTPNRSQGCVFMKNDTSRLWLHIADNSHSDRDCFFLTAQFRRWLVPRNTCWLYISWKEPGMHVSHWDWVKC
jgi:hypothetical protein